MASDTGLAAMDTGSDSDVATAILESSPAPEETPSDAGSAPMDISEISDTEIVMQASAVTEKTISAYDQQYIELRYPTKSPFKLTIADEDRLQDLTRKLGAVRIPQLDNYATAQNIITAHEKAKKVQELINKELEKARVDFERLGYDPLSLNLTVEQEKKEKKRCMDAALLIFGPAVLGR